MKRSDFLKSSAIYSASALVGYPLFKAHTVNKLNNGKLSDINVLSWKNTEHVSPYADSNLWIRQDGVDILNATQSSNGTFDPINGLHIDVIQMGIGNNSWPQGYSGYLVVTVENPSGGFPDPYTLYDSEVTTWKQGIIDSYTINLDMYRNSDGVAEYKVYCFTGIAGL